MIHKSGETFGWISGVRRTEPGWRFTLDKQGDVSGIGARELSKVFLCHPGSAHWDSETPGLCQLSRMTPARVERLEDVELQWFNHVYSAHQDVLVYEEPTKASLTLRKGITKFIVPAAFAVRRFMGVELSYHQLIFVPDPLGAVAAPAGNNGYTINTLLDRAQARVMRRIAALSVQRPSIRRAYASFFQGVTNGRLTFVPPDIEGYIRGVWLRRGDSALLVAGDFVPRWPELTLHQVKQLAA